MKHNIKDLINFPALLAELGVRRFDLQVLANYNPLCPEYQLIHNHELFAHMDEIKRGCEEVSLELKMDPAYAQRFVLERFNPQEAVRRYHATSSESKETRQCCLPWDIPFINREGRVFPCCLASTDSTAIMGDFNHEHWDSIWNGKQYRDFRKRILDRNTTPSICQRCNLAPRGKHPLLLEQNEQVALYDNMPSIIQKLLKRIQGIPYDNMAPRRFFTLYYKKISGKVQNPKAGQGRKVYLQNRKSKSSRRLCKPIMSSPCLTSVVGISTG